MERTTNKDLAALLKRNAEGLKRAGVEPSAIDMTYVHCAEAEDKVEEMQKTINSLEAENMDLREAYKRIYAENADLRAALQRQSENNREYD